MSLELGGKNAALVFADGDLEKAVEGTMRSVFANCGQVCLGTERVYVERPIFDDFVARAEGRRRGLEARPARRPGDQSGPLISQEHREKVLSYYEKAKDEGATVVTGGGVPDMPGDLANGAWIEPTIWTGLPDDSPIVTRRSSVPAATSRPSIRRRRRVRLPMTRPTVWRPSIWTRESCRARIASARRWTSASCWVNSWFLRDLRTAFGGSKQSGIGREGGVHSLEFYTELRNVCVKL